MTSWKNTKNCWPTMESTLIRNMKKFFKSSVIRYLILSVLAGMIGVNVFILNARHLTGNAVPTPFGYGASVVLSGSMEPTLSVGDLLIVQVQDSYEVDDIVVYQSGKMPVVHRIVELDEEMVTTRGDANNTNDEPFPVTAIKGEVIAVVPGVGQVLWTLKSPVATVIMLVLAVLLVEWSLRSGKDEKEAEKEKLKAEIRALMEELKEE